MKEIKNKFLFVTFICSLGLIVSILFLAISLVIYKTNIKIALMITGFIVSCFLLLFIFEYKKYLFAKLIVDNEILHLQPVQFKYDSLLEKNIKSPNINMDIYISCFGILIDGKILKFNINRIMLKKIEIDSKYICFTYGDGKSRLIRILYGHMNKKELEDFIEKFTYETGIVPVLKNYELDLQ